MQLHTTSSLNPIIDNNLMRVEVDVGAAPLHHEAMVSPASSSPVTVSPEGMKIRAKTMPPLELNMKPYFIPKNPSDCELIQSLFMDVESADVMIQVGVKKIEAEPGHAYILGQLGQLTRLCGTNVADLQLVASNENEELVSTVPETKMVTAVTFYAHRFILKRCSKPLFEMAGAAGAPSLPIKITSLSPQIFRYVLFYMYGGKIAKEEMRAHAKDIINAADWFMVSPLKIEAEACFVETTPIAVDNVMDHLLYADAHNCALLKEAAMDFIIEHKTEVLEGDAGYIKNAPGGILADILGAVARSEKKNVEPLINMRVCELRKKAHEKGLDYAGSREKLIAMLKE